MKKLRENIWGKTVGDNQPTKKTAASSRKIPLQHDDQQHLQCGQQKVKKIDVKFDFKFGSCDNDHRRRQYTFVTPLNTVPLGYLENTTTIKASSTTTDNQNPSKSPGRQTCLLSPQLEPQHFVAEAICASQKEDLPLVTDITGESFVSPMSLIVLKIRTQ